MASSEVKQINPDITDSLKGDEDEDIVNPWDVASSSSKGVNYLLKYCRGMFFFLIIHSERRNCVHGLQNYVLTDKLLVVHTFRG
jgi:hypothetical protein